MSKSQPRSVGRSVMAIVVGILVGIVLTLATDAVLHLTGFFPPLGQPTPSQPLMVATAYRVLYGILGSYIVARLAPSRPMLHALISGAIGVIASGAGAIATWNRDLGPHWYPIALIITALPCAWLGAKLRLLQMRSRESLTGTAVP